MKTKLIVGVIAVLMLFAVLNVTAASALDCGINISVAMIKVDSNGFAPRLSKGEQAQFDCVTAYDSYFYNARFLNVYAATDYWYILLGKAWGVTIDPIAKPSS